MPGTRTRLGLGILAILLADAVLPFALSFQSFKAIAGQSSQIQHRGCGFKTVEL